MRQIVYASVIGLLFSTSAVAQNSVQKPYDLPKTGQTTQLKNYLEAKFQDQLSHCMNKTHLTARTNGLFGKDVDISAIPRPLLSDPNLSLEDQVLPELDRSMARVFAYVYPTAVVSGNIQTQYIDMNFLQDPKTMLPLGESSTLYNYSCSSNLSFDLKANSDLKWPIADIGAALQADYSNSSAAQIGMVFGTFRSPLVSYYLGTSSPLKSFAILKLWEWYAANLDQRGATSAGFLLKQLDGTSSYRLYTNTQDVNGKVNFSAKLATPFASVDSKGETQYDSNQQIYSENFSVAVKNNLAPANFMAVPASDSIHAIPTSARLKLGSTDGRLLDVSKHVQTLDGVPKEWCNSDHWHVVNHKRSTLGDINLVAGAATSVEPPAGASDSPPSCSFLVAASGPFPAATTVVVLDYELATSFDTNDDVNDDSPPAAGTVSHGTISVHTEQVRLSTNGMPVIGPTRSKGIPNDTPSTVAGIPFDDLQYGDLNYPVNDDPNARIVSVDPHPTLSLTCVTGDHKRSIEFRPLPTAAYSTANTQLTLVVEHDANENLEHLDVKNYDTCSLNGSVSFTLTGGEVVPKTIPETTVYFPIVTTPQGAPVISSTSPTTGSVGLMFVVNGTGLTGTTALSMSGVGVTSFTINSDKMITAVVPVGARTGKIQVTSPLGNATSNSDFTVPQ